MRAFARHWNILFAILLAILPLQPDLGPEGPRAQTARAYADDDDGGGGRGGRNRSGNRRGDDAGDDDRSSILNIFRQRRAPRPRRVRTQVQRDYEPNIIIAAGLDAAALERLVAQGYSIVERQDGGTPGGEILKLRIPRRVGMDSARQRVREADPGATVDFNHYYRPDARDCTGDRCLLRHIAGWPVDTPLRACQATTTIGLIDTQINTAHPALVGADVETIALHGSDVEKSGAMHGTAVAALLVGKGEVAGLVSGWPLIAVDAFRKGDVATSLDLVRSIDLLLSRQVKIINMSLSGSENALLHRAVREAHRRDVVLIAAAGNDGPRARPAFPAAYPEVIAVTAVDRTKRIYRRAGQGPHIDIAAPGVGVWTAASIKGQRPHNGTSFAAPFVTAAAALIKAANPDFSREEIGIVLENQVEDLGEPGRDDIFGWGLLRIEGLCPD